MYLKGALLSKMGGQWEYKLLVHYEQYCRCRWLFQPVTSSKCFYRLQRCPVRRACRITLRCACMEFCRSTTQRCCMKMRLPHRESSPGAQLLGGRFLSGLGMQTVGRSPCQRLCCLDFLCRSYLCGISVELLVRAIRGDATSFEQSSRPENQQPPLIVCCYLFSFFSFAPPPKSCSTKCGSSQRFQHGDRRLIEGLFLS